MTNTLEGIGTGANFLDRIPMDQAVKSTIDKWVPHETAKLLLRQRTLSIRQISSQMIGKKC